MTAWFCGEFEDEEEDEEEIGGMHKLIPLVLFVSKSAPDDDEDDEEDVLLRELGDIEPTWRWVELLPLVALVSNWCCLAPEFGDAKLLLTLLLIKLSIEKPLERLFGCDMAVDDSDELLNMSKSWLLI